MNYSVSCVLGKHNVYLPRNDYKTDLYCTQLEIFMKLKMDIFTYAKIIEYRISEGREVEGKIPLERSRRRLRG